MKKLLIPIIAILALSSSCKKDPISIEHKGEFKLEFLFESDGCKMYRFIDGGRYIYWSSCSGNTYEEHQEGGGE